MSAQPVKVEVQLLEHQHRFVNSKKFLTLLTAGVGSGKTYAGNVWKVKRGLRWPRAVGFIGANTYKQLHQSTLPGYFSLLDRWGIEYVYNKRPPAAWGIQSPFKEHDGIITWRNGRQEATWSLDNFGAFRGTQYGDFHIDETRDTNEEAFTILLERLRGFTTVYPEMSYQGKVTTTPDGFTWLWERFHPDSDKRMENTSIIYASTRSNVFNPQDYYDRLRGAFSQSLAQQQLEGLFVSLTTGRAYPDFTEANMSNRAEYNPRLPLYYFADFNVVPLCSNVLQEDKSKDLTLCIDEVHIPESGKTRDACLEFVRRYKRHKGPVYAGGDASGSSGDTRGDKTDFDIIDEVFREAFGSRYHSLRWKANPRVKHRVNAFNSRCCNDKGERRFLMHPRCKFTKIDLLQTGWKPGTEQLDKGGSKKDQAKKTHHSDAVGYHVWHFHPVTGNDIGGAKAA